MLSKLLQIFFVLTLGSLLACFFSIPVRKINYLLGKNIPILKHRKKTRNIISVFIWYGLLLVFLFLIVGLLYYNIYQYFSKISWNVFINMVSTTIQDILNLIPFININSFESISSSLIQALMKLPGIIGKILIAFLISIYLLMDWDYYLKNLRRWRRELLSEKTNHYLNAITRETKNNLFAYLKGQSLDALIMSVLLSFGLWLIQVPLGVPIGITSGIGNLIPYAGPAIAFTLTTLFCLIEQRVRTLIIAIVFLIIVGQIDSSYIGPKLLGKQMQVRPLFVIVSILIGGTLFGVIGMLFAVPVAAALKTLCESILSQSKNRE